MPIPTSFPTHPNPPNPIPNFRSAGPVSFLKHVPLLPTTVQHFQPRSTYLKLVLQYRFFRHKKVLDLVADDRPTADEIEPRIALVVPLLVELRWGAEHYVRGALGE